MMSLNLSVSDCEQLHNLVCRLLFHVATAPRLGPVYGADRELLNHIGRRVEIGLDRKDTN